MEIYGIIWAIFGAGALFLHLANQNRIENSWSVLFALTAGAILGPLTFLVILARR